MTGGKLNRDRILAGLSLRRVGGTAGGQPNLEIVETVCSTNDAAWDRLDEPDADGLVIFAEHQSRGRGRLGRCWESPRGASLMCSVLLVTPRRDAGLDLGAFGAQLGLLTAVACHSAIFDALGISVEIKWPNDLMAGGRKLGGVLVESRLLGGPAGQAGAGSSGAAPAGVGVPPGPGMAHVVGIGINCLQQPGHFPAELRDRATSLDLLSAGPVDRDALAGRLLANLDRWFADTSAWSGDDVRREWLARAATLGQRIHLLHRGRRYSGNVLDLDPTASLLVQLDDGGRRLFDAGATTTFDP